MRLFLYETFTSGGAADWPISPSSSLWAEGAAMVRALAADLTAVAEIDLVLMVQEGLPPLDCVGQSVQFVAGQHDATLQALAAQSAWTLIIAPELGGELARVARLVLAAGGRLLGPNVETILWASDKQRTATKLAAAGIPCPDGCLLSSDKRRIERLNCPLIVKPVDGAGSQAVRRYDGHDALWRDFTRSAAKRVESFCPGQPASVSILRGIDRCIVLQPCFQHLSADGQFHYLGGSVMPAGPPADRARQLALAVADVLAPAIGYFGVDIVLDDAAAGNDDRVIEINPRMTTSYVGLRAATAANLAELMWRLAAGLPLTGNLHLIPDFSRTPLHFSADGRIETQACHG